MAMALTTFSNTRSAATQPSRPPINPVVAVIDSRLTITFSRDLSLTDLTLTIRGSDDLGNWTDLARSTAGAPFVALAAGVAITETNAAPINSVRVSDAFQVGDPAHPTRFLRLEVQH